MSTAQLQPQHSDAISPERRMHPRFEAAIQVEFRIEGLPFPAHVHTSDISIGGCYIETNFALELGARLNMVLWLNEEKVLTKGVVATRHPDFGNGIKFTEISSADEKRLKVFLNDLTN